VFKKKKLKRKKKFKNVKKGKKTFKKRVFNWNYFKRGERSNSKRRRFELNRLKKKIFETGIFKWNKFKKGKFSKNRADWKSNRQIRREIWWETKKLWYLKEKMKKRNPTYYLFYKKNKKRLKKIRFWLLKQRRRKQRVWNIHPVSNTLLSSTFERLPIFLGEKKYNKRFKKIFKKRLNGKLWNFSFNAVKKFFFFTALNEKI
jgi:hypothetical protein